MKSIVKMALLIFVSVFIPSNASALSVLAVANGDPLGFTPGPIGGVVRNGDFLIRDVGGTSNTGTGDGIDESTSWVFDFSVAENPEFSTTFSSFVSTGGLTSAFLTLELTVLGDLPETDAFQVDGLTPFGGCSTCMTPLSSVFDLDRSRVPQTVQIELLDFYTAYELLGILDDNYGTLAVQYADDALVSYASLELTAIPVPATLWLLGSGLLGLVSIARREKAT